MTKQLPQQYDSPKQPSSCPKEGLANLSCSLNKKNLVLIGPQMPLYIRPYLAVQHCFYTFPSNFTIRTYTFPHSLPLLSTTKEKKQPLQIKPQPKNPPLFASRPLPNSIFRIHSLVSTLLQAVIIRLSSHDNCITNKKKYLEIPFSLFQTLEYYPQKALPLYLMQNFKPTHIGIVVLLSQIKMYEITLW